MGTENINQQHLEKFKLFLSQTYKNNVFLVTMKAPKIFMAENNPYKKSPVSAVLEEYCFFVKSVGALNTSLSENKTEYFAHEIKTPGKIDFDPVKIVFFDVPIYHDISKMWLLTSDIFDFWQRACTHRTRQNYFQNLVTDIKIYKINTGLFRDPNEFIQGANLTGDKIIEQIMIRPENFTSLFTATSKNSDASFFKYDWTKHINDNPSPKLIGDSIGENLAYVAAVQRTGYSSHTITNLLFESIYTAFSLKSTIETKWMGMNGNVPTLNGELDNTPIPTSRTKSNPDTPLDSNPFAAAQDKRSEEDPSKGEGPYPSYQKDTTQIKSDPNSPLPQSQFQQKGNVNSLNGAPLPQQDTARNNFKDDLDTIIRETESVNRERFVDTPQMDKTIEILKLLKTGENGRALAYLQSLGAFVENTKFYNSTAKAEIDKIKNQIAPVVAESFKNKTELEEYTKTINSLIETDKKAFYSSAEYASILKYLNSIGDKSTADRVTEFLNGNNYVEFKKEIQKMISNTTAAKSSIFKDKKAEIAAEKELLNALDFASRYGVNMEQLVSNNASTTLINKQAQADVSKSMNDIKETDIYTALYGGKAGGVVMQVVKGIVTVYSAIPFFINLIQSGKKFANLAINTGVDSYFSDAYKMRGSDAIFFSSAI